MSKGTKHFFVCCTHVVVNIVKQQGKRSAAKLGNLTQETRVKVIFFFLNKSCNFQDLNYLYNRIKHFKIREKYLRNYGSAYKPARRKSYENRREKVGKMRQDCYLFTMSICL